MCYVIGENLKIGEGMLIDGYYTEKIRGAFHFAPAKLVDKILGQEHSMRTFFLKGDEYRAKVYLSFSEKHKKEMGQEYFSALHSVLLTKHETKKQIEKMLFEIAKKEESEQVNSERKMLLSINQYVRV